MLCTCVPWKAVWSYSEPCPALSGCVLPWDRPPWWACWAGGLGAWGLLWQQASEGISTLILSANMVRVEQPLWAGERSNSSPAIWQSSGAGFSPQDTSAHSWASIKIDLSHFDSQCFIFLHSVKDTMQ